MRITLIHPPICINPRAIQATRPSLPLGLAYLAAALREAGHDVSVLDALQARPDQVTGEGPLAYHGLRPEEIAEAVPEEAELVGVSVLFSFTWPMVRRIVHAVRARRPDVLLVGGGEHFAGLPEQSLRQAPLDYVIAGEGEAAACALVDALEQGGAPDNVEGVAFLRGGAFVETPRRARIRDLDALPWPAWDLFDVRAYYEQGHVLGVDTGMTMPILATRGCPYACTFCSSAAMWGRQWLARTPERVVDEIEAYHTRYGARNFPFHDLTAVLRKDWVVRFCEGLRARGLEVTWQLPSGTRCEVIDAETAELMRGAGCASITFAAESGSERTRRLVGKRLDEASLMRAVRAAIQAGMNVSCFFVVGFPHDTRTDLNASVRLAIRLARVGVNDIALSAFFPIPNTPLFNELLSSGRLEISDETLLAPIFSMNAAIPARYNYCEYLSAGAVTWMKYKILLAFYATSFVVRPWRGFEILLNVLRGRETCKMDIFLNGVKRRVLRRLGFGGTRRRAAA